MIERADQRPADGIPAWRYQQARRMRHGDYLAWAAAKGFRVVQHRQYVYLVPKR